MTKIFIIGDLHFPYHNKKALRKVYKAARKEKPTIFVQIGDLKDQYWASRFTKKNIGTSISEIQKARRISLQFWQTLRKICPKAKCYQLLGNHDIRLIKRIAEKVPEAYEIVKEKLDELYTFPGVKTVYDDRAEIEINGIIFMHGFRSRLGDHAKYNGKSTVCGHSHVGGVVFEQRQKRIIWELNAGYLADETAEPLKYRPQTTSKWTLGYGLITWKAGIPIPCFIPLR